MIKNPDPKKYRIKKLRGKGFILVNRQLDRWRKRGDSKVLALSTLLKKELSKEELVKASVANLFGDDE